MSDKTDKSTGKSQGNGQDAAPEKLQHFRMDNLRQYLKDLSFENPNAPEGVSGTESEPSIAITVNVTVANKEQHIYEVLLQIEMKTTQGNRTIFAIDVLYGGIFRVENGPEEHVKLALMVEAPRVMFPFVQRIIANATRDGGFPPVIMQQVDFQALYANKQRKENEKPGPQADAQGQADQTAEE